MDWRIILSLVSICQTEFFYFYRDCCSTPSFRLSFQKCCILSSDCLVRSSLDCKCWRVVIFWHGEDLLSDHAILSRKITCQGRDHTFTIRSGEGDLVLKDPRERLNRTSLHWPRYFEALGVIMGDFHTCEPEEGRFIQHQESNLHRR